MVEVHNSNVHSLSLLKGLELHASFSFIDSSKDIKSLSASGFTKHKVLPNKLANISKAFH